ncbi:MAG: ankyrin repeat domain-containing protein [Candidatus Babeliales bacterium]
MNIIDELVRLVIITMTMITVFDYVHGVNPELPEISRRKIYTSIDDWCDIDLRRHAKEDMSKPISPQMAAILYELMDYDNLELLQDFIKQGIIGVNSQNDAGNTLLHLACTKKATQIIQWLSHAGAKITIKNNNGLTVFDCMKKDPETLDSIIKTMNSQSNLDVNNHQAMILDLALQQNLDALEELYAQISFDLNQRIRVGSTFLHEMIKQRKYKAAAWFLNKGALISVKDRKGTTSWEYYRDILKASPKNELVSDQLLEQEKQAFYTLMIIRGKDPQKYFFLH